MQKYKLASTGKNFLIVRTSDDHVIAYFEEWVNRGEAEDIVKQLNLGCQAYAYMEEVEKRTKQ